jgi:hypothetical protein
MRKVVASTFVTVDGVFEDPGGAEGFELGGWSFKYAGRSEDELQYQQDLLSASDALLLGRVTYEGFVDLRLPRHELGQHAAEAKRVLAQRRPGPVAA